MDRYQKPMLHEKKPIKRVYMFYLSFLLHLGKAELLTQKSITSFWDLEVGERKSFQRELSESDRIMLYHFSGITHMTRCLYT